MSQIEEDFAKLDTVETLAELDRVREAFMAGIRRLRELGRRDLIPRQLTLMSVFVRGAQAGFDPARPLEPGPTG